MNACEKTCVYVWRGNRNLQKVQPSAGVGFSGWLKATPVAASHGDGLGTGSGRSRDGLAPGPLARTRTLSQGSNFVAGAAFWQGGVQISWQVHHFRKVKCRFRDRRSIFFLLARTHRKSHWHGRGRGSIFARSGTDFVAGASLSQGQVQNSWQVQHFRKVKCKMCGRRITFARSSTDFVAGAALSRGQVQISWQAQHFCAAGARKSQLLSAKVVSEVNFRSWGLKIATFKYESSKRSQLSQLGLENRNFSVRK